MNVTNTSANLVDAIELLTRKWNPPHRPPRPIRLSPTDAALSLPANVPLASLRGAYLRGLAIDRVAAERDCHWSDLRGTVFADGQAPIKDARFTLRGRIRGRPSVALLPQLRAWPVDGHDGWVRAVAYSRDGMRLATAGDDGTVRLWLRDTDGTAQQTGRLDPACGQIVCVAFKRDGTQVACGGSDGTIHRWGVLTDGSARSLGAFPAHDVLSEGLITVTDIAFLSAEDDTLASVGQDGALRVWRFDADGAASKPYFVGRHAQADVTNLACSRDGAYMATSAGDGLVVVWSATSGKFEQRYSFRADESCVNSLSISDDGSSLAAGGFDGMLTLWKIGPTSAQELGRATASSVVIDSVALGVSSRLVACSDASGDIQMWRFDDRGNLERCATLAGHNGTVHELAFNRDETQLASAGRDGTVRLWALLPNGTARETACLKASPLETRTAAEDSAEARLVLAGGADIDPAAYTFERSDGRPFDTEQIGADTLCADRLLHKGLCFCDPGMGSVPVFEVPPNWLQWSADRRRVVVPREVHSREELRDWADAGSA